MISSLVLCILALMIIKTDGMDRMVFIFYISAYVLQIFVYFACGNMLIESSLKISEAAYNFHWYKCNAKVRKTILMIMRRSQRKVNVKCPFFEVSLETFAWVSFCLIIESSNIKLL
jgi:gustatory receptor